MSEPKEWRAHDMWGGRISAFVDQERSRCFDAAKEGQPFMLDVTTLRAMFANLYRADEKLAARLAKEAMTNPFNPEPADS